LPSDGDDASLMFLSFIPSTDSLKSGISFKNGKNIFAISLRLRY